MANIFDKIGSAISSETLGEVDEFGQPLPKKPKEKPPKKIKEKKVKEVKKEAKELPPKTTIKDKKPIAVPKPQDIIRVDEQPTIDITSRNGKYPALKFLNIALEPDVTNLITPEDIENVEFSVTAPTGLNADEIEQFCDTVQKDIGDYLYLIQQRQKDFIKLLEHCEEISQKLIEQKQESELASFIIERQSVEDKLKEQLVELRLENRELKEEIMKLTRERAKTTRIEAPKSVELPDIDIANDLPEIKPTIKTPIKQADKPVKKFSLEDDIDDLLSMDEDPFDSMLDSIDD